MRKKYISKITVGLINKLGFWLFSCCLLVTAQWYCTWILVRSPGIFTLWKKDLTL